MAQWSWGELFADDGGLTPLERRRFLLQRGDELAARFGVSRGRMRAFVRRGLSDFSISSLPAYLIDSSYGGFSGYTDDAAFFRDYCLSKIETSADFVFLENTDLRRLARTEACLEALHVDPWPLFSPSELVIQLDSYRQHFQSHKRTLVEHGEADDRFPWALFDGFSKLPSDRSQSKSAGTHAAEYRASIYDAKMRVLDVLCGAVRTRSSVDLWQSCCRALRLDHHLVTEVLATDLDQTVESRGPGTLAHVVWLVSCQVQPELECGAHATFAQAARRHIRRGKGMPTLNVRSCFELKDNSEDLYDLQTSVERFCVTWERAVTNESERLTSALVLLEQLSLVNVEVNSLPRVEVRYRDEFERRLSAYARRVHDELEQRARSAIADGVPDSSHDVFIRSGDIWTVRFRSKKLPPLKHLDGFAFIAHLLSRPGVAVPCQEVLAATSRKHQATAKASFADAAELSIRSADLGEMLLDPEALSAITSFIEKHGDDPAYEKDVAALKRQLELDADQGKSRRFAAPSERARQAVRQRIHTALRALEEHAPELSRYLRDTIFTGRSCEYRPKADDPEWET